MIRLLHPGSRLLMVALGLSAILGCTKRPERPDLLVITLDTTRADRFSYAGGSPVPTPRIDALAAESTAFVDAVAPAPITLVSHASLFTGLLPPAHGVRNNGTYRLGDSLTTLAELLRDRGYRTGAFVGAAVLDSKYGLDQGFEHYDDDFEGKHYPERRGEEVVRAALGWLEQRSDEPSFSWVHLFDPHSPYEPPEPEKSSYPMAPYDGEIAYVDRVVGLLLDGYRQRDRYRHLVVVLTADHGESLGEHGESSHGVFLYDATMRVPLLIRVPGLGEGVRVAPQVQLIDVVPTLTELLDLEAPTEATGRSLLPAMRGAALDPQPAYVESFLPREKYGWSELRGLRTGGWKLVLGAEAELYDLTGDPEEIRDLAAVEPERLRSMQRIFEAQFSAVSEIAAERVELDDDTRRQLAALGYVSTSRPEPGDGPTSGVGGELPDPRRMIHLSRARSTAQELFDRGFHRQAIERAEAILQEDPSNIFVRTLVSTMLLATGGIDQAERHLSILIRQEPVAAQTWRLLATVQERTGRSDEAVAAYRSAHQADSTDFEARARAWELMLAAGDRDGVAAEAAATLESNPNDVGAQVFLAVARWRQADPERLLSELGAAADRTPGSAELLAALGDAYSSSGDYSLALPLYSDAQRLASGSSRYAIRMARTLSALGRPRDVRLLLGKIDKRQRFDPEVWLLLGEACQALGDRACAARALSRVSALVPGPLIPFLDRSQRGRTLSADARRRRIELLLLAGRSTEAEALWSDGASGSKVEGFRQENLFAGVTDETIHAASALLVQGEDKTARQSLGKRYRGLDLSAALVYATACARAGDSETVREILTLLAEVLVSGEGPPGLSPLSRQDRLAATAALVQIGSESWNRYEFPNAMHAYAVGAHLVADDPRPHYNLGLAWERIGDFREALEAFRRTLELDPNFPRAREHHAALMRKTGIDPERE